MLDLLTILLLVASGMVMVVTAYIVLHACHRFEISSRSISALLLGFSGAWEVARVYYGPPVELPDLLLPLTAAVYIVCALWRRYGAPARRVTDIPTAPTRHRPPWIGSQRS